MKSSIAFPRNYGLFPNLVIGFHSYSNKDSDFFNVQAFLFFLSYLVYFDFVLLGVCDIF